MMRAIAGPMRAMLATLTATLVVPVVAVAPTTEDPHASTKDAPVSISAPSMVEAPPDTTTVPREDVVEPARTVPESTAPSARPAATADGVDTEAEWRDALAAASTTEPNVINITGSFTIAGATDPVYAGGSQTLTVNGGGFTLSGGDNSRILRHGGSGAVTVDDATLTNGSSTTITGSLRRGGAIDSIGPVTVTNTRFADNTSSHDTAIGGAIFSVVDVTVSDSTLTDNTVVGEFGALGGAVYSSSGVVTVTDSTLSGNTVTTTRGAWGGAVESGGDVAVTNSTFTDNTATATISGLSSLASGGAINARGDATVANSTFTDNTASAATVESGSGGAISANDAIITNSTFTGNAAGTGATFGAASGTITASVLDDARGGGEHCASPPPTSGGHNYVDDDSCGLTGTGDDQAVGNDPGLAPLDDYGGPTETRRPQIGSPLLDTTPADACAVAEDQRGIARPQGTACETGAVEFEAAVSITKTPAVQTIETGATASFTITVENTGSEELTDIDVTDLNAPDCERSGLGPLASTDPPISYDCSRTGVTTGFTNTATVTADTVVGPDSAMATSGTATVVVVDPGIVITVGPESQTVEEGEPAVFTVTVRNDGDTELTGIDVEAPGVPDCERTDLGPLAVGASLDYTCTLADPADGFSLTGRVSADSVIGPDTAMATSGTATVVVVDPGIVITVGPESQTVEEGEPAVFTVTVRNDGDTELTGIDVEAPGVPDCERTDLGPLAVGASLDYTCTLADPADGFSLTGRVSADSVIGPDTATDESNAATVTVTAVSPPPVSPPPAIGGTLVRTGLTVAPLVAVAAVLIASGFALTRRRSESEIA